MLVRTPSDLDNALAALRDAPFVALDTEFMRESTYYPKLCLIQVAAAQCCAIFDPLALDDCGPLFAQLAGRGQVKVLHAARQDLEVLSLATPLFPFSPVFDTQVAAALLGFPAQIGYGDLVARRLGVTLPKGHTRTDWSRRPLSEEQLAYAADDVKYLVPLYEDLRAALATAGRLAWLEEEMRAFDDPGLYRVAPEKAWKRLKGLDQLSPLQRAAAKLLAEWREHRAIRHDRPRGWILADDLLRTIAQQLPGSMDALAALRDMPPALARKHGEEILELLRAAPALAEAEPPAARPVRPENEQLARIKRITAVIRDSGERLGLSPELLGTRRDVERLVLSGDPGVFARGWRKAIVGDEVLALANR